MPAWDPVQCNPLFTKNSVCRCCCDDDFCNERALPCDENPTCPPAMNPTFGSVECSNMNFLNSTCSYKCNPGYNLVGDSEVGCFETSGGLVWERTAPKCERAECDALEAPERQNGRRRCSDSNKVGSSCIYSCDEGYELMGNLQINCNLDGKWSNESPTCIRVTCDIAATSNIANGETICEESNFYASVCVFSCRIGFYLEGDETTTCQQNGEWTVSKPTCQRVTCEKQDVEIGNGLSVCSDSNFYGSTCTFACDEGYLLIGPARVTCQDNFIWSTPPSFCEQITCEKQAYNDFENGDAECTDSNIYGSSCAFTCDDGYFLTGQDTIQCIGDGVWSNPPPSCQRETCGPADINPQNGLAECDQENKSFSKCKFSCGLQTDNWDIFGSNETACEKDPFTGTFEWTNDPPCCAKRCPPFAQVDLFLVLDSSSSVGKENWNKTVYFVKSVIDNFVVSSSDMLVAAIRYNRYIDTDSEILIGQYQDLKSTTDAIINLPYDGSGTLTGQALTYVREKMLTAPGNRPNVQDMVLVVTDGISKDDTAGPASELRSAKANVVALGVVNEKGSLKKDDIIDIAGDPEKTVLLESGFGGLTDDLVEVILNQICGDPCDRRNQYAEFIST
uniref:E-selectin-like n=1 Tax=Phallusia mammillata TaxID=59560 RepID=A0A6F9DS03_9ASCI|nr:E-selectin-like [Phallusia mammillata]